MQKKKKRERKGRICIGRTIQFQKYFQNVHLLAFFTKTFNDLPAGVKKQILALHNILFLAKDQKGFESCEISTSF